MKKLFFSLMMCFCALSLASQEYVDLGLPSGTKWKSHYESGYFSYNEAVKKFGNQLPTAAQLYELIGTCEIEETKYGKLPAIKIVGPNGNSIMMVLMGYEALVEIREPSLNVSKGGIFGVGEQGFYMTSNSQKNDDNEDIVVGLRLNRRQDGSIKVKPTGVPIDKLKCLVWLVK